jgi:hypothetical protein
MRDAAHDKRKYLYLGISGSCEGRFNHADITRAIDVDPTQPASRSRVGESTTATLPASPNWSAVVR